MGDLIHAPGEEALSRFGGSKGAEKFAREGMRFEREPEKVLPDVDQAGRVLCGVKAGQPHRLEDAVMNLPFETF